ncbi:MAG: succinate dehydrogenase [Streptosporangiales bacterium]|nr:succinate dehydrogenase [Streptosporangiales bacterium]
MSWTSPLVRIYVQAVAVAALPRRAYRSTVGKKAVMAVTGGVMFVFLVAHMVGNLKIFAGPEAFNHYSEWLRTVGSPAVPYRTVLTLLEVVLLLSVVLHITAAVQLARRARAARPVKYRSRKRVQQSYASRTMRWGGVIIALFVIYHLLDLTFLVANPAGVPGDPYGNAVAGFSTWYVTLAYTVALIAVGFHLRHGLWSALQTLGRSDDRRERAVNVTASVAAVLLIAGFLSVPFAVITGLVGLR